VKARKNATPSVLTNAWSGAGPVKIESLILYRMPCRDGAPSHGACVLDHGGLDSVPQEKHSHLFGVTYM